MQYEGVKSYVSLTAPLLAQKFVKASNKEDAKALHHWSFEMGIHW